jgi:hypothetical protein
VQIAGEAYRFPGNEDKQATVKIKVGDVKCFGSKQLNYK